MAKTPPPAALIPEAEAARLLGYEVKQGKRRGISIGLRRSVVSGMLKGKIEFQTAPGGGNYHYNQEDVYRLCRQFTSSK